MEMKYKPLMPRCECGRPALKINEVGLTADHQLVLHWRCPACRQDAYAVKPLSDCWRDCPRDGASDSAGSGVRGTLKVDPDQEFLRALGVRLPE